MPKMGESVMEGTVLSWLKNVGDAIEEDESILEVATDKVDTEIPSTHAGVLKEILAEEGEVVQVGKPIAIITTESEEVVTVESNTPAAVAAENDSVAAASALLDEAIAEHAATTVERIPATSPSGKFYSPLVRNMAKEEGIALVELEKIAGSGKDGRVTKNDMLAYIKERTNSDIKETAPKLTPAPANGIERKIEPMPVAISGEDEIIEMDRMRKMIAERMVASKAISPHVTSFVEADMTNVVKWRNANKKRFKEQEGQNLTFTPIIMEAVIRAIKDYPMINVQVNGSQIIKKGEINMKTRL